jgi:4-oxalocrotonate tautomerase family enzyme
MPLVTIEGPKIDVEVRRRLAEVVTKAASEAFGLGEETVVVIMREVSSDCVASGGTLICDLEPPEGASA